MNDTQKLVEIYNEYTAEEEVVKEPTMPSIYGTLIYAYARSCMYDNGYIYRRYTVRHGNCRMEFSLKWGFLWLKLNQMQVPDLYFSQIQASDPFRCKFLTPTSIKCKILISADASTYL